MAHSEGMLRLSQQRGITGPDNANNALSDGTFPLAASELCSPPALNAYQSHLRTGLGPQFLIGNRVQKRTERPNLDSIFSSQAAISEVNEHAASDTGQIGNGSQSGKKRVRKPKLSLDLEREMLASPTQQEVDLRLVCLKGSPVGNVLEEVRLLVVGLQEGKNPAFQ